MDPDGGWDGWYDRNSVTYFVDGVQVDGWEYEGYFKNSPPGSTLSMMGSMFAGMSLPVLSFSKDRGFGMWLNEKDMVAYGLHANFNTGTGVVAAMDYDVVSHFFGINNVGDYGLSNTLIGGAKSVAEFSGGVVVGIGEGAWGTVKGLGTFAWGLVSNSPVENGMKAVAVARGIGSAVYNYDKTWSAITASVSQGYTEFVNADAYGKGKTTGHVLEGIAETFMGGAVTTKLANATKAMLLAEVESVVVTKGTNLALGLKNDLNNFAKVKKFDTYRAFMDKFDQKKLEEAFDSYEKLHFNVTDFSKSQFSRFDPSKILTHNNYTNWEMHTIFSNPNLLGKTTFYKKVKDGYEEIENYSPHFKF